MSNHFHQVNSEPIIRGSHIFINSNNASNLYDNLNITSFPVASSSNIMLSNNSSIFSTGIESMNSIEKRNTMYNFNTTNSNNIKSSYSLSRISDKNLNNSVFTLNHPDYKNMSYLSAFYKLLNTYNINLKDNSSSTPEDDEIKRLKLVKRNQSFTVNRDKSNKNTNNSNLYNNTMSANLSSQAFLSSPFCTFSGINLKTNSTIVSKDNSSILNGSLFTKPTNNNTSSFINNFNLNSQPLAYDSPSVSSNPIKKQTSDLSIRFAVNGISKFAKATSAVPTNRSIQAGDFGDDSGMVAENSRCIVIGLADGAGGNRSIGIDPQIFSRSLLGYCVEIIKNEDLLPTQMAKLACRSIQILESKNIQGSGTLCLLGINKFTNMMHSLNIGDSGFRLIRNGEMVHKSEPTMSGSSPRQLYVSESSSYSNISFVNEQEIIQDSDVKEFAVQKGDLIVLSSDGMFDVVQDNIITKVVNKNSDKDLQTIADELLLQSMKSYVFTQRDDILVMVCKVESRM